MTIGEGASLKEKKSSHKHKHRERDRETEVDIVKSERAGNRSDKTIDSTSKRDRDDKVDRGRDSKKSRHEKDDEKLSTREEKVIRDKEQAMERPKDTTVVPLEAAARKKAAKGPSDEPDPAAGKEETAQEQYDVKPRVDSSNNELSMSIEETNRVRISLGLKPLQMETRADKEVEATKARAAARAEAARKAKAEEMAERIKEQKERRIQQEKLRNTKTLGEAADDVDDVAKWVVKSRRAEEQLKAAEKAKAEKLARQLAEQDEELDDSDEEAVANAQELAGMKVRHSAEELNEGETMILTLADREILDERGEIDDNAEELENLLVTEDKVRRKAFKAATKKNVPLFGEDGKVRNMLEKYDAEEVEAGMQIDASGAIEDARRQKQAAIRERLKAAESAATTTLSGYNTKSDYFTQEEMAQFQKNKTKKKRKLRKKDTETEGEGLDLAALEAQAAATGNTELGSRKQRAERDAAAQAAHDADLQERRKRYENALGKANEASLALQPPAQDMQEDEVQDEADDDLSASLARARRAAQLKAESSRQPGPDEVAAQAARRRQAAEEAAANAGGLEFTEAKEFAQSIQLIKPEEPEIEPADMDAAQEEPLAVPTPAPQPPPEAPPTKWGSWVPADKVDEETKDAGVKSKSAIAPRVKKEPAEESLVRERRVGVGLAGALSMLKERGELEQPVEWAGRVNDMKTDRILGMGEVYTGGRNDDKLARDIENALTERDEWGRILTPRERFRRQCYEFHGKGRSKNKEDKRIRKAHEELLAKRMAGSDGPESSTARLRETQQTQAAPYVVLSGKVRPGQTSDPASGYATVDKQVSLTPVLGGMKTPLVGGGQTPLEGKRKVEVMLGLKQESGDASTMPPPPPRVVRK